MTYVDALEMLACPVCHADLAAATEAVRCTGCGRLYPVVDGIPILLPDRAVIP
jgi:uncharacterized protein YbaR (Trm112 family)